MMTKQLEYFDRQTQQIQQEQIYGGAFLRLLYEKSIGKYLLPILAKPAWFSKLYGLVQKSGFTKRKVAPFIRKYGVDATEFSRQDFKSFNEFFTRTLKKGARPIADAALVMPADGRYLVIPDLSTCDGIWVKGKWFDLAKLLGSEALAEKYQDGALVIARLCPVDYHRFHFPCDCVASQSRLINGYLYSVSPLALVHNIDIFSENKRYITELQTQNLGTIQYIEVGATNVGSVVQTASAAPHAKGEEKGYFEFGGSCVMLLIEKGRVQFADDLLKYSAQKIEVRALMGQPLASIS
ncbi:MAG: phosphatidylserine decarboxylase [Chlamydiales bacterium]|nr:phosphatidylserine decarboxylase [Chlamydiales bacterium]